MPFAVVLMPDRDPRCRPLSRNSIGYQENRFDHITGLDLVTQPLATIPIRSFNLFHFQSQRSRLRPIPSERREQLLPQPLGIGLSIFHRHLLPLPNVGRSQAHPSFSPWLRRHSLAIRWGIKPSSRDAHGPLAGPASSAPPAVLCIVLDRRPPHASYNRRFSEVISLWIESGA